MASPQTSNGFAPIANELLDAILVFGFNRTQVHVILWVIRMTYGWRRKSTEFTWYTIAKDLGMSRSGVTTEGSKLIDNKVLVVRNGTIGIQKDYEKWIKEKKSNSLDKTFRPMNVQAAEQIAPVSQVNVQPPELKPFSQLNKTVQAAERFSDELKQENKKTNTTSLREVGNGSPEPKPETPLQQVMNHYILAKGLVLDKEKTRSFYDRFGKAAKGLLKTCELNPDQAKKKIDEIGKHLNQMGLSWTLDTITKWTCDPSLMNSQSVKNGTNKESGEAAPIPGKYAKFC